MGMPDADLDVLPGAISADGNAHRGGHGHTGETEQNLALRIGAQLPGSIGCIVQQDLSGPLRPRPHVLAEFFRVLAHRFRFAGERRYRTARLVRDADAVSCTSAVVAAALS